MANVMLSTIDNPYSPFDDFDSWYSWDMEHGYNTCSLLALYAPSSIELSELEEEQIIEAAIDTIVNSDPIGIRVKLTPEAAKLQQNYLLSQKQ